MGTEMIVVNENWSMPECIKQMRMQAEDMDEVYYVYVVDNEDRLRGTLPLKKLITHPSVSKIRHVMETDPVAVKADTPIDDVALDFEKYDLVAMPVIDSIGRLLGRITVDDVMDKVRDSSERDYQLASGLSGDVESDDKLFARTKARLPWLLIGMVGGLCNSVILGRFEGGFVVDPAPALFIPLIGGTGGNVGTQSSAIVVQGLANGSLDIKKSSRQLLKELGVGLLNGSIIALLVFLYNFFTLGAGHEVTTFAVSISIFCVVMFASVFGTFVPLTLEKLKIDPAIATGPFISITNDIIGMLIYMSISTGSSSSSPTDHPTGGCPTGHRFNSSPRHRSAQRAGVSKRFSRQCGVRPRTPIYQTEWLRGGWVSAGTQPGRFRGLRVRAGRVRPLWPRAPLWHPCGLCRGYNPS